MTIQESPLVSISCTTYNHEKYIAAAIDSFLMQETSFPIEILLHDDASTDKTPDIIREYVSKYPDIIKPIFQEENQFSKGLRPAPQLNYPRALGKYIAICEGDDFWTDPLKLQKQVAYLETHPDVFLCGHAVKQIDDAGNTLKQSKFDIHEDQYFTQDDMAYGAVSYPMLSVLFRNSVAIPNFSVTNGDTFTFCYFSNFGDAYISKEKMGVHRFHQHGIWSSLDLNAQYDARLHTFSKIPAVIDPKRRALTYLAYFGWAKKDHKFTRKIRIVPYTLLMTLLWLRPNSARFILRRLSRRYS